jgi:predicted 2-oxoglutarate/Fe(II)-dependent dioxygenase YbiX|tara:strand:- start:243 stop:782 length:540 start_codon:yes stop_codon:yes gene_type:complete
MQDFKDNLRDYTKIYNNVLDLETCDKITQEEDLTFYPATTNGLVHEHRKCLIKKLNDKHNESVKESIEKIKNKYLKEHPHLISGFKNKDTGYDHLLYRSSANEEYKEHVDNISDQKRILSCSIILNDNYKGGNFYFFNKKWVLAAKKGSAIVFPSNFMFPHSVAPVTEGDRHSIVTWIY